MIEVDGTGSTAVRIKAACSYSGPWIIVIKDGIASVSGRIVLTIISAAAAGKASKTVATSIAVISAREAIYCVGLEVSPCWTRISAD